MIVELEFDAKLEVRFYFSYLPASLMEALGRHKQALFDATGPFHNYGATGSYEIESDEKRFLVLVRLGDSHKGEGGEDVRVVRILHIIENTVTAA